MVRVVEMSRDEFEDAVRDALDEIPDELAAMMDNVVVLVEDAPPEGEVDLLGLDDVARGAHCGRPWWAERVSPSRARAAGRRRCRSGARPRAPR